MAHTGINCFSYKRAFFVHPHISFNSIRSCFSLQEVYSSRECNLRGFMVCRCLFAETHFVNCCKRLINLSFIGGTVSFMNLCNRLTMAAGVYMGSFGSFTTLSVWKCPKSPKITRPLGLYIPYALAIFSI